MITKFDHSQTITVGHKGQYEPLKASLCENILNAGE